MPAGERIIDRERYYRVVQPEVRQKYSSEDAMLLAIVDAGLFIESAAGAMPLLSAVGAVLSWIVLAVWWNNAAAAFLKTSMELAHWRKCWKRSPGWFRID